MCWWHTAQHPSCATCRTSLGPMKHNTEELHSMLQRVSSSEDLLELSQSAAAAKQTGATLAARQAEILNAVSQELLCSPEIIRCNLLAAWCMTCSQAGANSSHSEPSAVPWFAGCRLPPASVNLFSWDIQAGRDGTVAPSEAAVEQFAFHPHTRRLPALVPVF